MSRSNRSPAYLAAVQACADQMLAKMKCVGDTTRLQLTLFAPNPDATRIVNHAIRRLIEDGHIAPYKNQPHFDFRYRLREKT